MWNRKLWAVAVQNCRNTPKRSLVKNS